MDLEVDLFGAKQCGSCDPRGSGKCGACFGAGQNTHLNSPIRSAQDVEELASVRFAKAPGERKGFRPRIDATSRRFGFALWVQYFFSSYLQQS